MRRFSLIEKFLVLIIVLLAGSSLAVSYYNVPVWKMILTRNFNIETILKSLKHQESVGVVLKSDKSELTRKKYDQYSYDLLEEGSEIYDRDFLINTHGTVSVKFHNGEVLEIGPNSSLMVNFKSEDKMDTDVFRASKIEIFSGSVVDTSAPQVQIVEKIKIVEKQVQVPGPERVVEKVVEKIVEVEKPLVELSDLNLEHPLVSGEQGLKTNIFDKVKENFFVDLKWGGDSRANKFDVLVSGDNKNFKNILTTRNSYARVMQGQVFTGRIFFKVLAYKDNLLINKSDVESVDFAFYPPELTNPEDQHIFVGKSYITWKKTSFTKGYDLEISRTSDFKASKVIELTNNFYELSVSEGVYYWRVRSKNDKKISAYSSARVFKVEKSLATSK